MGSIGKFLLGPILRLLARVFVGARTWDALFGWLIGQAPRIFGGKYAAEVHGRKSRDYIYVNQYLPRRDAADKTSSLWDDSAVAWARGYHRYEIEEQVVVGQLEQVMADITEGRGAPARQRLGEVIRLLRGPT